MHTLTRRIIIPLLLAEVAMGALHFLFISETRWPNAPPGFLHQVNLNREMNIPTWFSSSQFLLLAAVLFWIATRSPHPKRIMWCLLGGGALFLSADETAMLHETVGGFLERLPVSEGSWLRQMQEGRFYLWVVAYLPVAVPAALVMLWFLWKELRPSRWWVALSLGMFFFGAVGLDAINGIYRRHDWGPVYIPGTPWRLDLPLGEEMLEMMSVTLILTAFLEYAVGLAAPPDIPRVAPDREQVE